MSHAITIGDVFTVLGLVLGIVIAAIGVLAYFAGSMSDAPSEGDSYGRFGCSMFLAGALIAAYCVWTLA